MVRAFPAAHPAGQPFSPEQRAFLQAVVDNDDSWGHIANPMIYFLQAGLPTERDELRELLRR